MEFSGQMLFGAALVMAAFIGVIFEMPFEGNRVSEIKHFVCMIMGIAGFMVYMGGTMKLVYPPDAPEKTMTETRKS
jgi:hypothetical protein